MARKGKSCSWSTCRMISPTAPVAPTTATLGSTNRVLSESAKKSQLHHLYRSGPDLTRGSGRRPQRSRLPISGQARASGEACAAGFSAGRGWACGLLERAVGVVQFSPLLTEDEKMAQTNIDTLNSLLR